jgi:hypothetical protein
MTEQQLGRSTPDTVRPDDLDTVANNNITAQRLTLWITPVVGLVFLIAFVSFPGFFPPMSPGMTADQVATFFKEHATGIRFSMVVYDVCGVMLIPFFCLIVVQMKRMATPSQVFAYCYLSAVATGTALFAISQLLWLIAAFRPERNPELVQLLNDMAWIVFTAPVGILVAQNVCLGLAVYLDAHPQPIFPRWVGHLSILVGVALVPAAGAAIFTSGPLAWNGVVSFWLKNGVLSVYIVVMFFVLRNAINRQAGQEQAGQEQPGEEGAAQ